MINLKCIIYKWLQSVDWKANQSRLEFHLAKLRHPNVAGTFKATKKVGNLHHSSVWEVMTLNIDSMITNYNIAVTSTASMILGKERRRKSPGPPEMFLTTVMTFAKLYEKEGAKKYRKAIKRVQKALYKTKED